MTEFTPATDAPASTDDAPAARRRPRPG
ncbi:nucleoid occlusion factor SlmA, partial [Diaphorobacter sp. DS2]